MNVLVTGGTGSLGSGVVDRLLRADVAERVTVVSRDETRQAEMSHRLESDKVKFVLCDVRDPAIVNLIGRDDVVVHAAAMKRIEVCEENPALAVDVNVTGTANVLNAALKAGASRMVLVSTDKAVEPSSAMGMSKALAEKIVRSSTGIGVIVRLCNVLGTRGSLVPLVRQQIEKGTVYITDESMVRFFITKERAVNLIILAAMGEMGDVSRDLYWPEGAQACGIATMIAALCLNRGPDQMISRKKIGARPGERLHEKMLWLDEAAAMGKKPEQYYTLVAPKLSMMEAKELLDKSDKGAG